MNPDIICVGYTVNKGLHVICNDAGLAQLPEWFDMYRDGGGNLHNGVWLAWTPSNMIALQLLGVLSSNDIDGMAKRTREVIAGQRSKVEVPEELVQPVPKKATAYRP